MNLTIELLNNDKSDEFMKEDICVLVSSKFYCIIW